MPTETVKLDIVIIYQIIWLLSDALLKNRDSDSSMSNLESG